MASTCHFLVLLLLSALLPLSTLAIPVDPKFPYGHNYVNVTSVNPIFPPEFSSNEASPHNLFPRWDPGSLGDCYCGAQLPQWFWATVVYIDDGISYLQGKPNGDRCWIGANSCSRVSCSWDSGIWVCNDLPDALLIPCSYVANYVLWLRGAGDRGCVQWVDTGEVSGWGIKGQLFDKHGYNVIVHSDTC